MRSRRHRMPGKDQTALEALRCSPAQDRIFGCCAHLFRGIYPQYAVDGQGPPLHRGAENGKGTEMAARLRRLLDWCNLIIGHFSTKWNWQYPLRRFPVTIPGLIRL